MSIEAINAAMSGVREHLLAAHQHLTTARHRVADALELLTELSRDHSESLVPPQLPHADERLGAGLEQVAGSVAAIDRFVAML